MKQDHLLCKNDEMVHHCGETRQFARRRRQSTHSIKVGLYETHLSVALNGIDDKCIKQTALFSLIFLLLSREVRTEIIHRLIK